MTTHENVDRLAKLFQEDLFAGSLDVELTEWHGGAATATATPGASHRNFAGGVHGGFLFAGADFTLAVASNSWGRLAVAVSVNINYVAPGAAGAELEFVATEVSRGRNLATYSLEVHHETKLIATATGTTFRSNNWHFGADAWSDDWREHH